MSLRHHKEVPERQVGSPQVVCIKNYRKTEGRRHGLITKVIDLSWVDLLFLSQISVWTWSWSWETPCSKFACSIC